MTANETIDIMERCSQEIKSMRRRIGELETKANAYDSICIILGLLPRPSVGYGEDLAWRLNSDVKKMREKMKEAQGNGPQ